MHNAFFILNLFISAKSKQPKLEMKEQKILEIKSEDISHSTTSNERETTPLSPLECFPKPNQVCKSITLLFFFKHSFFFVLINFHFVSSKSLVFRIFFIPTLFLCVAKIHLTYYFFKAFILKKFLFLDLLKVCFG